MACEDARDGGPPEAELRPGDQNVDIVGSRDRLLMVGMSAVFIACAVFAVLRLGAELSTGLRTPWWGNAIGAVLIPAIYLWYRGDPTKRSAFAVHGTALVATVALLIPAFYGMPSSKWWLALVGFSVLLMGRPLEAAVWTVVTLLLVPVVSALEPVLTHPQSLGESTLERAMAGLFFLVLLFGITLAFRRVAERRARELRDMAESLERASKVRNHFLAHMSHEIRTPLHGAIAMTDLALDEELPEPVRPHIQAAYDSAQVLLTLLNNILDVTRADAGAIELAARPFDLHGTLSDALAAFTGQARARGLTLTATSAPGVVRERVGDPARLMQIVLNLVGNALKFTERGAVRVAIEADVEDPDVVRISVEDTGRGIPPEELPHIFTPFAQGTGDSRFEDGAGLGLPIARALALLMGGDMDVWSEVSKGSRFSVRVRLPVDPDTEPTPGPEDLLARPAPVRREDSGERVTRRRVLVCEDHPTSRRALGRMLSRLGHDPVTVENGALAWERLQAESFDLLITDIEMPGVDGFELLRLVREREREEATSPLPVVAATAHVGLDEADRLLEAGASAHLPKPFTMDSLRDAIRVCLPGAEVSASA